MNILDDLDLVWVFWGLWFFGALLLCVGSVLGQRRETKNSFVSVSELISFKVLILALFGIGCGRVFTYIWACIGTYFSVSSRTVPDPYINRRNREIEYVEIVS
jgi:hypothetical protein